LTRKEIKELDALWSKKIKELAKYRCEHCKEPGRQLVHDGAWLNSAHIIGRRYRGTRWSITNGMCLCYSCHRQWDEHGPQHEDILRRVIGRERLNVLIRMAKHKVTKYQDYDTIKRNLI